MTRPPADPARPSDSAAARPAWAARRVPLAVGLTLALVGAALVGRWVWARRHVTLPPPPAAVPDTGPTFADFVGAATCATCHAAQYARWRGSTHGDAGGAPTGDRIIAPFNDVPLRFKDALVVPSINATGEYTFTVTQPGRLPVALRVDAVVGGGHLAGGGTQAFFSEFPDGTIRFLPFDYSKHNALWFCNTNGRANRGAVPITPAVALADCGDWPPQRVLGDNDRMPNCQQCHGSQIQLAADSAGRGFHTRLQSLAVNCEACHGPGRRHVEVARSGAIDTSANIGLVLLDTLSKERSVAVCLRCHSLKERLRPGYLPGGGLEERYALKFPALSALYLPDGRTREFAYQAGHLASDCYVNGSMTCVDCHEPHTQRYRDIAGAPLPGRFHDGQCVDCHPSKAVPNAAHTHHPPDSPGSRCTSCHMPYRQLEAVGHVVRYARSDHTISISRPAFDARLGVENVCQQCHADRSSADLEAQVEAWYGTLKPPPPLVTGMVEAHGVERGVAAELLLAPDPRRPVAAFAALNQFQREHLYPDMPKLDAKIVRQLRRLARSEDRGVQALALAGLHLARGEDPGIRRFLAAALAAVEGVDDRALRDRWGMTLLFWADRSLDAGDVTGAIATLRKAEEVRPADPTAPWKLGIAAARRRDVGEAVRQFRRSLVLNPNQPLVLSDLALALLQARDVPGALEAAQQAADLDPWDPSGFLSLGYAYLADGQKARALEAFRKATVLAPGLAKAHMGMARALGALGDRAGVAKALERVLEFEPGNAEAHRVLGVLRARPVR